MFEIDGDEFDPTDYGEEIRFAEGIEANPRGLCMTKGRVWFGTWPSHCRLFREYVFEHCCQRIEHRLVEGYVRNFKIGITSDPVRRFNNIPCATDTMAGYRAEGYHVMWVLASSGQRGIVGPLEVKLLNIFRFNDYESKRTRPSGHHLCANQRKGGEGADYGPGPYYLYCCWRFNPGANELR